MKNKKNLKESILILIFGIFFVSNCFGSDLQNYIKQLNDSNSYERIQGLINFTTLDRTICLQNIEKLVPLLYDDEKEVRRQAIIRIGVVFLESPKNGELSMPPFNLPRLKQDKLFIKKGKMIVSHLIKKIEAEDSSLKTDALFSVACIGIANHEEVKVITKLLKDDNENIRYRALVALGNIGKNSKETVPLIKSMLNNDKSNLVRNAAKSSLTLILK